MMLEIRSHTRTSLESIVLFKTWLLAGLQGFDCIPKIFFLRNWAKARTTSSMFEGYFLLHVFFVQTGALTDIPVIPLLSAVPLVCGII